MIPTRRTVLKGLGGIVGTSVLVGSTTGAASSAGLAQSQESTGIALAVAMDDDGAFRGLSQTVDVTRTADPVDDDDEDDEGDEDDEDVIHITSLGGNEEDPTPTTHYGISVVDLTDRDLTVSDIDAYERDGEGNSEDDDEDDNEDTDDATGGFVYDWYVGDADSVGVDTDQVQTGVGPDEAWLLLEDPEVADDDDDEDDGDDEGEDDSLTPGDVFSERIVGVFRTMYADDGTETWQTRSVAEEFQEADGPWKRMEVRDREFVEVGPNLLEEYGDWRVRAVGVGRGDPFYGPSILDTYYRGLEVNGESYTLPSLDDEDDSEDGGNGGEGNGGNGNGGNEGNGGDGDDDGTDGDEDDA